MMTLEIDTIRIDGGTQPREAIDEAVVAEYAEAMGQGAEFPPVSVVSDGAAYWLVDGFHRYHAYRKNGEATIPAEVTKGTLDDAVWLSLAANQKHGMRRTNADKQRAVKTALARWPDKSDRAIAEHVGVDHKTVAAARPPGEIPHLPTRTGRDGKQYPATRKKPICQKCKTTHYPEDGCSKGRYNVAGESPLGPTGHTIVTAKELNAATERRAENRAAVAAVRANMTMGKEFKAAWEAFRREFLKAAHTKFVTTGIDAAMGCVGELQAILEGHAK